ncbi:resolvase [Cryobacterium sp. LW097]|uniref:recombinase family protein n=1 Tax=unclassified Cryobacterium TaxID=2649013 RepID=UPI000B4D5B91|nr:MULTISPECIES: recombinase family protein [unclassified Cryobacterium]ASD21354.1 resolvase [Cryobacterium sp. LW097]TFC59627.1 recombinase family protein [Cryobacterium sp. TMB1-7]
MIKLIGYARISTRQQDTDVQRAELLAAGVRRDDLYIDQGSSGARAARPQFYAALAALEPGDTFVIATLDRLGQSTQNVLAVSKRLSDRGVELRVLDLGGEDVDTGTPMGSMLFTIMAALGQMEHEIKRERVLDSIDRRRKAGKNLGGRPRRITNRQIRNANRLIEAGEPTAQVARDFGMSRATFYRRARTLGLLPDQSGDETPESDGAS